MFSRPSIAVFLALFSVAASGADPVEEAHLKERAHFYYTGWQKKDVEIAWNFLSPRIRAQAAAKDYLDNLKVFYRDNTLLSFEVRQVTIEKDVAYVETMLSVKSESAKRTFNLLEKTRWVLVPNPQAPKGGPTSGWYIEDKEPRLALHQVPSIAVLN